MSLSAPPREVQIASRICVIVSRTVATLKHGAGIVSCMAAPRPRAALSNNLVLYRNQTEILKHPVSLQIELSQSYPLRLGFGFGLP